MRKFIMNPFNQLHVKGRNICQIITFALFALSFGACSDDDETVTVEFPAQQEITCNVGETAELSFNASTDWQLTSSALWCKFLVNGEEEFAVSGTAGSQKIQLVAGEEAHGHEMSAANISLAMGNQKMVIAKVLRSAKGYELKVYNEQGEEINEIEVGYDSYIPFTVKSNFRFAATNRPSWAELNGGSLVGGADKEVSGGLKVVQNGITEKYPVVAADKQMLVFADENGKASFEFPLVFKGMNPKKIEITGVTNNPWDWTVSLDGKTFVQESASGLTGEASKTLYKSRLPFTIKALNDDYELVYIQKVEVMPGIVQFRMGEEDGINWMSFDKATQSLSVQPSMEEREGFVLAFPAAQYEEIKDNLYENLIESTMDPESGMSILDIKYEYTENNLLINFVQKEKKADVPTDGFNVKVTYYTPSWQLEEAEVTKAGEDDGNVSEFGTEEVYYVDKNLGSSFFIDPMIDGDYEVYAMLHSLSDPSGLTDQDVTEGNIEGSEVGISAYIGDIEINEGQELQIWFKQDGWKFVRVVIFK